MANNFKAYVKRTILESAREYAGGNRRTKESTKGAFMDALHGTDSGWWSIALCKLCFARKKERRVLK
mgnify:CR=1 FL=1